MRVAAERLSVCYPGLVWLFLGQGRARGGEGRDRCFVGREAQTKGLARWILLRGFVSCVSLGERGICGGFTGFSFAVEGNKCC